MKELELCQHQTRIILITAIALCGCLEKLHQGRKDTDVSVGILALTAIALGEVSQWAIALLLRLNLTGGTGQKKGQIRNRWDFEDEINLLGED